jgi:hypothetical protein
MSGIVSAAAGTFAPSVSAGFFFATAIAWMDVIRWTISQLVNVSKNGGSYYLMSAIFTTLLSVIVLMILARLQGTSYFKAETSYFKAGDMQ